MAYCCSQSTCAPGFIADHTCDGVFAGYGGIVGAKHVKVAIMQFVVTAAVLVLGVVVAANGNPKPDTSDNQTTASISTAR